MSWFTTLVLISPETSDEGVFDAVAALLAPFDSDRTVVPYIESCLCVETDSLSRPDLTCAECCGTGKIRTTVNPKGYWESWRIGGGTCEDWLGPTHAMRAGDAAAAEKIPFALVTPDGRWHGGWHSPFRDDAWDSEALRLLRQHADALAVACTLHD